MSGPDQNWNPKHRTWRRDGNVSWIKEVVVAAWGKSLLVAEQGWVFIVSTQFSDHTIPYYTRPYQTKLFFFSSILQQGYISQINIKEGLEYEDCLEYWYCKLVGKTSFNTWFLPTVPVIHSWFHLKFPEKNKVIKTQKCPVHIFIAEAQLSILLAQIQQMSAITEPCVRSE